MAATPKLPTLDQLNVKDLVFTIGNVNPGKGRIIFVRNPDGTDASFQCGEWTADLTSSDPEVRNKAMEKLPRVRSSFHQSRVTVDKKTNETKTADAQTIEMQLSDAEIEATDRLIDHYATFLFENQQTLWPKEKPRDLSAIRSRIGDMAKINNDGSGRRYMHLKVHYPTLASNGAQNPRSKHYIVLQDPNDLSVMNVSQIQDIQRNQPCVLTCKLTGMCITTSAIYPTAEIVMFGGCAFDPNAGARDPSMFTNFGMKINNTPAAATAPADSSAAMDTQTFVADSEVPMETSDPTSNHF